jgi:hypothetical protein
MAVEYSPYIIPICTVVVVGGSLGCGGAEIKPATLRTARATRFGRTQHPHWRTLLRNCDTPAHIASWT